MSEQNLDILLNELQLLKEQVEGVESKSEVSHQLMDDLLESDTCDCDGGQTEENNKALEATLIKKMDNDRKDMLDQVQQLEKKVGSLADTVIGLVNQLKNNYAEVAVQEGATDADATNNAE